MVLLVLVVWGRLSAFGGGGGCYLISSSLIVFPLAAFLGCVCQTFSMLLTNIPLFSGKVFIQTARGPFGHFRKPAAMPLLGSYLLMFVFI